MKALECKIPPPIVAGLTAALMWGVARSSRGHGIHLPARGWIELALLAAIFGTEFVDYKAEVRRWL